MRHVILTASLVLLYVQAATGQSFVNWESPHGNPLDLTPNGGLLLAVNTPDNRLEVFAVGQDGGLTHVGAVPVGLDPVSVRARNDNEAWVANHVSDSISVVDLNDLTVKATIAVGDEPVDVLFAGDPERAFVSVSQLNQVKVYDPIDLTAVPDVIDIDGEDPRALATDGSSVYVAIFESGNKTSILGQQVVSSNINPYPGDLNPPPNNGDAFDPPIDGDLPTPPEVSLIVKKNDATGNWLDDNAEDWSAAVTWDIHDNDVAIINVADLGVSYVTGLMNADMNLAVAPNDDVLVIGTDGINHIRFEPNVQGIFVRVLGALLPSTNPNDSVVFDLNPHLDYSTPSVPQATRELSIGDPRGIAWSGNDRVYIAGMGSNNVVALDGKLARIGLTNVGEGPTAIRVNSEQALLYVLNKFEGSISIVDEDPFAELERVSFHDPTPETILLGRPHLYNTHQNSGLGQASCASCHIDGRMDQLAWDLGDPQGEVKPFNQVCNFGVPPLLCEDWHPMKGPMTTQTLVGIVGTEPFHWRGDREDLAAFNIAFESLMSADQQLSEEEMSQFTNFVATLTPPPNPNRNLDGSLQQALFNGGNPVNGENLFNDIPLDGGAVTCVTCHALPTGTNGQLTSGNLLQETQSIKIPQLRNLFEKTGFDQTSLNNNRGFGFIHDGSVDTLFSFLQFSGFSFAGGETGNQQRRDVEAFLFSLSTDTHAGVGAQATLGGDGEDQTALRDDLIAIAQTGAVDMVAKGIVNGEQRGYYYLGGGNWQSDRAVEVVTTMNLDDAATISPLTFTLVPFGSAQRIGVDRDKDGFFDRDEIDACADPADPVSVPGDIGCPADINGDLSVDIEDLLGVLAQWGAPGGDADIDCSGSVDISDLLGLLAAWGPCE